MPLTSTDMYAAFHLKPSEKTKMNALTNNELSPMDMRIPPIRIKIMLELNSGRIHNVSRGIGRNIITYNNMMNLL